MMTRRIIYAVVLAGAALFFVLYPFWFSWYFLVLTMMIVPLDLLISLPGMLSRRVVLSVPKILEMGEPGTLVIVTMKDKPFPAKCIKAWLKVSGEGFSTRKRYIVGAERDSRYEIAIDTTRTGITKFESKRIWTVSLIGLFCLPTDVNCRSSVLVLPPPQKPPNTVTLPRGVILRPKPGGGFSEDYDMRPYREGDPIRSVHWKVSAKFDSLIIREPLIPPAHSRLLHAAQWKGAKERDLILGHLRWISAYLLKWELPFFVKLGDDGPVAEVTKNEDLLNYLFLVLSGMTDALPHAAVPVRFAWVFRINA